jgi:hypothetical protein
MLTEHFITKELTNANLKFYKSILGLNTDLLRKYELQLIQTN